MHHSLYFDTSFTILFNSIQRLLIWSAQFAHEIIRYTLFYGYDKKKQLGNVLLFEPLIMHFCRFLSASFRYLVKELTIKVSHKNLQRIFARDTFQCIWDWNKYSFRLRDEIAQIFFIQIDSMKTGIAWQVRSILKTVFQYYKRCSFELKLKTNCPSYGITNYFYKNHTTLHIMKKKVMKRIAEMQFNSNATKIWLNETDSSANASYATNFCTNSFPYGWHCLLNLSLIHFWLISLFLFLIFSPFRAQIF